MSLGIQPSQLFMKVHQNQQDHYELPLRAAGLPVQLVLGGRAATSSRLLGCQQGILCTGRMRVDSKCTVSTPREEQPSLHRGSSFTQTEGLEGWLSSQCSLPFQSHVTPAPKILPPLGICSHTHMPIQSHTNIQSHAHTITHMNTKSKS